MNLLQTILDQIKKFDLSSVSFPLDEITGCQEVVGTADASIKRTWGFLQQIRNEAVENPHSGRTKAMVQIVELYLIETIREQFPAPDGKQVVGIGNNGQIYWAKYSVHNSNLLNQRLNAGTAFFMHLAA